jgi:hypothetical protein
MYKSDRTYEIDHEVLDRIVPERGHTPKTLARHARLGVRAVERLLDPNAPRKVARMQTFEAVAHTLNCRPERIAVGSSPGP